MYQHKTQKAPPTLPKVSQDSDPRRLASHAMDPALPTLSRDSTLD